MDRLGAMEAFVRVIETGSFSAAARQLRVGQPAVSKTVAQLEERLGVRLLLRSSHGLTPTEAGQGFYERAKRAIEEADEADLAARGAGYPHGRARCARYDHSPARRFRDARYRMGIGNPARAHQGI